MSYRIITGDALERLRELPDESVHCAVTSPPYWGLRDYGVSEQIGLEPTPNDWCARLVEVFREVRRMLRSDGCAFINCGDSYQEKQLIGLPWLLAFALRADGWYLRADCIWAKNNPMPESVNGSRFVRHRVTIADYERLSGLRYGEQNGPSLLVDCPGCPKCAPHGGYILKMSAGRPTKAHEYVFVLTKSATYFWDAEAVREPNAINPNWNYGSEKYRIDLDHAELKTDGDFRCAKSLGKGWKKFAPAGPEGNGRNLRSVWTITSEGYADAHFATFPTALARRCILAGTSAKGVCPDCGAPWVRVVERGTSRLDGVYHRNNGNGRRKISGQAAWDQYQSAITTGWRPSCTCDADEPVAATILDPFAGAATTLLAAEQLGRDSIGIELSPQYAELGEKRIARWCSERALGRDVERHAPLPGQLSLLLESS